MTANKLLLAKALWTAGWARRAPAPSGGPLPFPPDRSCRRGDGVARLSAHQSR